ncbi:MAG: hypothetical protein IPH20_11165 [Bacteroidales bacterium]|nr:hypothetical protein [Bacteroidales bacterium]
MPNPTSKLEVDGQIKSTSLFGHGIVQSFGGVSLGTYIDDNYAGWFGTNSNHPLWFYVNGGFASMVIDTTGQVGIGTIAPDVSAALDVSSTTKGFLPPRMTAADRSAIATPAEGLLVYQTDAPAGLYYYSGGAWTILSSGANNWAYNGANISNTNSGNVGIGASNPTSKLEVAGQIKSTGSNAGIVQEAGDISLGTYIGGENAGWFGTNSNHPLWFYVNNGLASMAIDTTGKVGIGTTNPQSLLEIQYNPYNYTQLGYTNSTLNMTYHHQLANEGDGQAALYGLRTRDAQNDGTSYGLDYSNTALRGYSFWGDLYSFGTSGYNYNDFSRCGGILGAEVNGFYWGSLGYRASSFTNYGGYFTSSGSGAGKSSQASTSIGIGAWGDLMGADIHGKIYGIYAEGGNYATFSNGPVYKNNIDVHLQKNSTGTNSALYTNVSTDVTVQTSGVATLSNGRTSIVFDKVFAESVSSGAPVIVTVTPVGKSNGVYLDQVSKSGFTVVENNDGRSNVTVNYIAIAKRAGYENPNLSPEVVDAEYTGKMERGLHNDADTQTNGEGLYYENGNLVVGKHSSTLPDPNKPSEESYLPKSK